MGLIRHEVNSRASFEMAARIASKKLDAISERFPVDLSNTDNLVQVAMTSLGSKMFVLFVWRAYG